MEHMIAGTYLFLLKRSISWRIMMWERMIVLCSLCWLQRTRFLPTRFLATLFSDLLIGDLNFIHKTVRNWHARRLLMFREIRADKFRTNQKSIMISNWSKLAKRMKQERGKNHRKTRLGEDMMYYINCVLLHKTLETKHFDSDVCVMGCPAIGSKLATVCSGRLHRCHD